MWCRRRPTVPSHGLGRRSHSGWLDPLAAPSVRSRSAQLDGCRSMNSRWPARCTSATPSACGERQYVVGTRIGTILIGAAGSACSGPQVLPDPVSGYRTGTPSAPAITRLPALCMICNGGRCGCPAGTSACGNACVDLTSSLQNCGRCGNVCPSGAACANGVCACSNGLTACTNGCADLLADLRTAHLWPPVRRDRAVRLGRVPVPPGPPSATALASISGSITTTRGQCGRACAAEPGLQRRDCATLRRRTDGLRNPVRPAPQRRHQLRHLRTCLRRRRVVHEQRLHVQTRTSAPATGGASIL